MSTIMKSLGIDRMPRDKRLALVQEIWETIAAEQTPPLLDASRRLELERRMADDDSNPDDVVAWEEIKAQALDQTKP
jgi:putative addiction module component (TIGR02574 family)